MKALKANCRARDEGSLMIVSGILLVLAFAVTALTLSQIADLEKRVASESSTPIISEYRFLREKLGSTLADSVTRQTTTTEFGTIFSSAQSELKALAHQGGYDLLIYLADGERALGKQEWSYTDLGHPSRYSGVPPAGYVSPNAVGIGADPEYALRAYDNSFNWEQAYGGDEVDYDGTEDGMLRTSACQSEPTESCIQGAIVWFYLADQTIAIEEFIVYGLNT